LSPHPNQDQITLIQPIHNIYLFHDQDIIHDEEPIHEQLDPLHDPTPIHESLVGLLEHSPHFMAFLRSEEISSPPTLDPTTSTSHDETLGSQVHIDD